jgi:hypothetical protein
MISWKHILHTHLKKTHNFTYYLLHKPTSVCAVYCAGVHMLCAQIKLHILGFCNGTLVMVIKKEIFEGIPYY